MAKTAQFNIKINGTDQLLDLNSVIDLTAKSLETLKTKKEALDKAFSETDFGTDEFNKIQAELKQTNSELKIFEEQVEGLNTKEQVEGVTKAFNALGSTFAAVTISAQAFGDAESDTVKELQKLETQILAVVQIQQAYTTVVEAFTDKASVLRTVMNFLTGSLNKAGIAAKLFGTTTRAALLATGVGVLIFAVTALIQNFDKLKSVGSGLFKTFQPFFDGVRNFASFITNGLIDNASLSRTKSQLDSISKSISKAQTEASQKLETISKRSADTSIERINKLKDEGKVYAETSKMIANETTKLIDLTNQANKESIDAANKDLQTLLDKFNSLGNSNSIENGLNTIEKTLDTLNKKYADPIVEKILGKDFIRGVNKIRDAVRKNDKDATNAAIIELQKQIDKIEEFTNKNKKFNETIIEKIKLGTIQASDTVNIINQNKIIQDQDENQLKTKENLLTINNGLLDNSKKAILTDEQKAAKQDEIAKQQKANDIENINNLLKIQQINNQIGQEKNKQQSITNNLFKSGIDLIIQYGNILNSSEFDGTKVFAEFNSQLDKIEKRLKDKGFKGSFKDVFTFKEGESFFNSVKLTDLLNQFRDDEKKRISENGSLAVANIENQIRANEKLIKLQPELAKEYQAQNKLLRENQKTIGVETTASIQEVVDNVQNLINVSGSIPDQLQLGKLVDQQQKAEKEFEDFQKSIEFTSLSLEDQNIIINDFTQNQIDNLTKQKELAKNLATVFPQLKDSLKTYTDQIQIQIDKSKEATAASNTQIAALQLQLGNVQRGNDRNALTATISNPDRNVSDRKKALSELAILERKDIKENFDAKEKANKDGEKGLAIIRQERFAAEQALNKKLIDLEADLNVQRINNYRSVVQAISDSANAIFDVLDQRIQLQLTENQDRISQLDDQLAITQERLQELDSLINDKKSTINDLLNQAKDAQGGQRQEILDQIDKEVELTKKLTKEKEIQARAEDKINKRKAALEKENQNLQKESIKLQKQAAVVAGILSAAQSAAAIATLAANSAKNDGTFGVATISAIVALGIALVASIGSTVAAIKSLNNDTSEQDFTSTPAADGGYTGSSNRSPDQTGERPTRTYQLHENEWISPRWMTQSPTYGPVISELERARKRGFADGGTVINTTPVNTTPESGSRLEDLLIANLNKPSFVAVTDINEGQNRVNVIESRTKY